MTSLVQAEALTGIARAQATLGDGWAALNAQLGSDTLVVTELLAGHPDKLPDIGPMSSADLGEGGLAETIRRHREHLLSCLSPWGLAAEAGAALAPLDGLEDLPLDPAAAPGFAAELLQGMDADAFVDGEAAKAARLYRLGARLYTGGDFDGALNCAHAADTAAFLAHHARAGLDVGDPQMSVLRTAFLLADHQLALVPEVHSHEESMEETRRAFESAVLTAVPLPWEPLPHQE